MPEINAQTTWADALNPRTTITGTAANTYEVVTEKPLQIVAYRIPDLTDVSTDIGLEAQRCAQLPGARKAAVEYRDSDTPRIIIELRDKGQESVRCIWGGWLVIRSRELGPHLLDADHLLEGQSGRIMLYNEGEFAQRYEVSSGVTPPASLYLPDV